MRPNIETRKCRYSSGYGPRRILLSMIYNIPKNRNFQVN